MRVSAAYLERVARNWQAAFTEAHGKTAPPITWAKGWFTIKQTTARKYRRTQIEAMTKVLRKGFKD